MSDNELKIGDVLINKANNSQFEVCEIKEEANAAGSIEQVVFVKELKSQTIFFIPIKQLDFTKFKVLKK